MEAETTVVLVEETEEGVEDKQGIYATVESVGQREFFAAAQVGFKPEYKLTVWSDEYSRQSIAVLYGCRYSVYRTYNRPDGRTELYLSRKAGV